MSEDQEERERVVAFHREELATATERLVHQTMVCAEEERVRQGCAKDVAESRANLDRALHALLTKAGKP